jgi:hypothetical protein
MGPQASTYLLVCGKCAGYPRIGVLDEQLHGRWHVSFDRNYPRLQWATDVDPYGPWLTPDELQDRRRVAGYIEVGPAPPAGRGRVVTLRCSRCERERTYRVTTLVGLARQYATDQLLPWAPDPVLALFR